MYPLFSVHLSLTNLGTIQERHMLQLGMMGFSGVVHLSCFANTFDFYYTYIPDLQIPLHANLCLNRQLGLTTPW